MKNDNTKLQKQNRKINVLIFPCESNSNELHAALSYCFNLSVFGGSSVKRHGAYIYRNYNCNLPCVNSDVFLQVFNNYLDENEIDVIMPTHDTIALFLAENADKIHAKVVQSDIRTNKVCRSKVQTHETFIDCEFVPKRYLSEKEVVFPAFAKPDVGEGGHGAFVVKKVVNLALLTLITT